MLDGIILQNDDWLWIEISYDKCLPLDKYNVAVIWNSN